MIKKYFPSRSLKPFQLLGQTAAASVDTYWTLLFAKTGLICDVLTFNKGCQEALLHSDHTYIFHTASDISKLNICNDKKSFIS